MSESRAFLDGRVILHAGDCRDVLRGMVDNSVDSVVTDPPYHLQSIVNRFGGNNAALAKHGTDGVFKRASAGFMNKQWDGGDIAFQPELWAEVLRVLKPGGYIMAFSGCRTYHRMACAIEDAGFITHPFFAWAFGSGFPKAHSVSKQIDRNGPQNQTSFAEFARHCSDTAREWDGWFYGTQACKPALEPVYFGQKPFSEKTGATNVLKWGVGGVNIEACKVGTENRPNIISNRRLEHNTYGPGLGGSSANGTTDIGRWPANLIHDGSEEVLTCFQDERGYVGDSGSAARFFASFPQDNVKRIWYGSKADADDRLGSKHPTVKPIALIQYLVRLITPKNGVCLDLFAGTGTTGEACFRESFRAILIEREAEYIADIERRMSLVMKGPVVRSTAGIKARGKPVDNGPLFVDEAIE